MFPQIAKYGELVGCLGMQHFTSLLLGSQSCKKHRQPFLALGGWIKPENSLADANTLSWQDSRIKFRGNLGKDKTFPHHYNHSIHPLLRTQTSTKVQPNKPVHSQAWTRSVGGELWMRWRRNDYRLAKMACFQICHQVRKMWNSCLLLENTQKCPQKCPLEGSRKIGFSWYTAII